MQILSEPVVPQEKSRRRFRLRAGLSLRAFLVFTGIVAIVLATWVKRTREQHAACELLAGQGISYTQGDPPAWLRFLPDRWLNAYGGHWCRKIVAVDVTVGPRLSSAKFNRTNNPLAAMARLPSLEKLKVINLPFSNDQAALIETLAPLQNINGLEDLEISVFNGGYQKIISALPVIPTLKGIVLASYSPYLEASLHGIEKLETLENVVLEGAPIDGNGFRDLASLPRLKSIQMRESLFTAADLECFREHPTLEQFACNYTLTDEMLKIFASCPHTRIIDATNCYITDDTMRQISELPHLETLILTYSSVGDEEFRHLANCKSLKNILCENCKITDAVGPILAQIPLLETIDLYPTLTTGRLLPFLKNHRQLALLSLNTAQTDIDAVLDFEKQQFEFLSRHAPFDLENVCYHFGSRAQSYPKHHERQLSVEHMARIHGRLHDVKDLLKIAVADLEGTDIDDTDLQLLGAKCNLENVNIAQTRVSAAGLSALKNQTSIVSLTAGPFDDADEAMRTISTLPSLIELTFRGSQGLSEWGLKRLQLMNLTSLELPDRQFDEDLAKILCQIPLLEAIQWSDRQWERDDIVKMRLQIARKNLGIPQGLEAWFIANPTQTNVTIVDSREWASLRNRNLNELHAPGVPITSDAIDVLLSNFDLNYLDLSGTGITGDMLTQMKSLSDLETLILNGNAITDADIRELASFYRLKSLGLARTKITDKGLQSIFKARNLNNLNVAATAITDRAWKDIGKYSGTIRSSIDVSGVADPSAILKNASATMLPETIVTHPDGSTVSAESLLILQKQRSAFELTELDITPELLHAWSIDEIFDQKIHLSSLSIHDTRRSAEILAAASRQCPVLHILSIHNEPLAFDRWNLPTGIQSIEFNHCTITDSMLDALPACQRLRSITFNDCRFNDCQLDKLSNLSKLVELTCSGSPLSRDQLRFLKKLESSLISTSGW